MKFVFIPVFVYLFGICWVPIHCKEWDLVWSDNFTTPHLNSNLWKVDVDCWGDSKEDQQCYTSRRDNLRIENGKLIVQAYHEKYKGNVLNCTNDTAFACVNERRFTSARLRTVKSLGLLQGKLIIRAKVAKGAGLRSIFSLLPLHLDGNAIQITTLLGNRTSGVGGMLTLNQFHFNSNIYTFPCIQDFSSSFHDFGFTWTPEWLRWYVDGVLFHEVELNNSSNSTSSNESSSYLDIENFQLVLGLAVGGKSIVTPTNHDVWEQSTLVVEHVHIFQEKDEASTSYEWENAGDCSRGSNDLLQNKVVETPNGSCRGYLCYSEVQQYIEQLKNNFPDLTVVEDIGVTFENRSITSFCFGACKASNNVPAILYTGMHHAREPMSMMVLIYLMEYIQSRLRMGDMSIKALLDSRQLWFIPVVNPDGYAFNERNSVWKSHVGQRKNRRPECTDLKNVGVDLNRNYPICWDIDSVGSNKDPCSEDYRGEFAFSEAETKAIKQIVEAHNFSIALNYHSFGKFINIPYSCRPKGKPVGKDAQVYDYIAKGMASTCKYEYGQSWTSSNLYSVNGESSDWMYNAHGIFAMSPETGPSFTVDGVDGFWPFDKNVIQQSNEELLEANLFVASISGSFYSLAIENVVRKSTNISLTIKVTNSGVRPPSGVAFLSGGHFLNGSDSIDPIPIDVESVGSEKESTRVNLVIPTTTFHSPLSYFLVIQDDATCAMYRASLGSKRFQLSQVQRLPLCGTCSLFRKSTTNLSMDCSNSLSSFIQLPSILSEKQTLQNPEFSSFILSSLLAVFVVLAFIGYKFYRIVRRKKGNASFPKYEMVSSRSPSLDTRSEDMT